MAAQNSFSIWPSLCKCLHTDLGERQNVLLMRCMVVWKLLLIQFIQPSQDLKGRNVLFVTWYTVSGRHTDFESQSLHGFERKLQIRGKRPGRFLVSTSLNIAVG